MKHNDWTQQLHDRLSDHKASVPDGLWDKIESQLDKPAKKRVNVVTMRLTAWIGAAAAILLLVVGAYHINRDTIATLNSGPTAAAVQKNAAMPVPGKTAAASESGTFAAEGRLAQSAATLVAHAAMAEGNADGAVVAQNAPVATVLASTAAATDMPSELPDAASAESGATPHDRSSARTHVHNSQGNAAGHTVPPAYTAQPSARGKASGWSFGVHTGNIMTESRQSQMPALTARSSMVNTAEPEGLLMSSYPLQLANYREARHHNIPVLVGATASYAFGKRVTLATGLVYTRAASDFIQSSGSDEICEKQTLHYIGVPLSASYSLFGAGSLHAYVTAGAQADFNVSATLKTEGVSVDIKKDRPQFSVNAAVGVQYDIIPQLGLYAEPGVRYYIDNNSSTDNIFKDKPCNFSLQVGLRFNVK